MREASFPIYCDHFGLSERPFSLLPDPHFLFWSANHASAYGMLEYALATFAPLAVITGEIGAGKSTLIQHLLRAAPASLRIGLVSNAHADRGWLIDWAMQSLGQEIEDGASYVRRFSRFEAHLRAEFACGNQTALVFDEAQNLSEAMLEELRCFTDLNGSTDELLQIILVGQPELNPIIDQPRMLQFAQRVSARYHLTGMPREAVRDYVAHRLAVAGAETEIFSPTATDVVFIASHGLPRVINQICDRAMVYAYAEGRTAVNASLVQRVVLDRSVRARGPQPQA